MEGGLFKKTNKVGEERVSSKYDVLSRFYYDWVIRMQLRYIPEGSDKLSSLLLKVKNRFSYEFKSKESEFSELMNKLSLIDFKDDEDMLIKIIDNVFEFAKTNFTREELEKLAGDPEARGEGIINLNELLDFSISKDGSRILIHLKPTSKTGINFVKDGLSMLAEKLNLDPSLADIKTISATSWMVAVQPGIFEKLGFKLSETDETKSPPSRRGEISRADFINIYGKGEISISPEEGHVKNEQKQISTKIAGVGDGLALKKIRLQAVNSPDSKMFGQKLIDRDRAKTDEEWEAEVSPENKDTFYVIFEDDKEPVGMGRADFSGKQGLWYINSMYMDDLFRGKVFPRKALKEFVDEIKRRDGKKVMIGVRSSNERPIVLYKNLGFTFTKNIPSFLMNIFKGWRVMELDLTKGKDKL
ncbi:MAG: GNAT family N-acetyltransferase [Candidatus Pacebacteria bacterium]|nr:GNAT family N-acetyltransferase [Candidatus Paceibacterota bacterium]